MDPLLIGALGLLIVLWVVVKKREASATTKKKTVEAPVQRASQASTPYHAVAIRPGRRVCEGVKELNGQRILSNEAPMLPLPDCDIVDCGCSYVHYKDRRCGKDRRSPFNSGGLSAATGKFQVERREAPERRQEDSIF